MAKVAMAKQRPWKLNHGKIQPWQYRLTRQNWPWKKINHDKILMKRIQVNNTHDKSLDKNTRPSHYLLANRQVTRQ